MRYPQVVVFEHDGRLAHVLHTIVAEKRWVLRESRQTESCLRNMRSGLPTVLVLALPDDGTTELELLDRISQLSGNIRKVVVCESATIPALPGLAWDLGADFVLSPPMSLTHLPEIVGGLMRGIAP